MEKELFEAQRTIADMEGVASANRAEIMRLRNVVKGCREEGIQRRYDALTDAGRVLVDSYIGFIEQAESEPE